MITSIELQVISKILTSDDQTEVDQLLFFDSSYYSLFKEQIEFIFDHKQQFGTVPDVFTFQSTFTDITLVQVNEPVSYLSREIRRNKQHIILLETFNKIKDLSSGDVTDAWRYISAQCDRVSQLDSSQPMDIIHQAKERSDQIIEFNKQARIPTGFAEIDKLMYGGLSTVEELALVFARTNTGKSWVLTRMMESAQKHRFPSLYYSPEMQASFLATRFDTWRKQFKNSDLHQGKYSQDYIEYINELEGDSTPAFVLEDKDAADGVVNVGLLQSLVKKHHIKLVIVDGLSYMEDMKRSDTDYVKYKNICSDLFRMSKQCGCAVVIAMQANRETRSNSDKSEDGKDAFPNLYNLEGSDHPGRIATQAFALRQVWDKHILDIRLEKSRNAANQKPTFSYSWDPNTGSMSLIDDDQDNPVSADMSPVVNPQVATKIHKDDSFIDYEEDDEDEGVEF